MTSPALRLVALMMGVFLLGTAIAWPGLAYPMVYDDLHLVRTHTWPELTSVWAGTWDVDGVETAGFRPLTTLFNHARSQCFGENVVAHRLGLLFLFALFLALLGWVALQLGMTWTGIAIASGLTISARYSIYHYGWIADGIHLAQGCLWALALACLIRGLRPPSPWWLLGSLLAALASVLVREDSLGAIPVLAIIGSVHLGNHAAARAKRWLLAYVGILGVCCAMILIYRRIAVPEALAPALHLQGLAQHLVFALSPLGLKPVNPIVLMGMLAWYCLLIVLIIRWVMLRRTEPALTNIAAAWLISTFIAATPGLTLARTNLVLFPLTFAMFAVGALFTNTKGATSKAAVGILACTILLGAYNSRITMHSFHPYSLTTIIWNSESVYGNDAAKLTIPSQRKQNVIKQLEAVGIKEALDSETLASIEKAARQQGYNFPQGEPIPFIPSLPGLLQP